jgi:hypothetical protein
MLLLLSQRIGAPEADRDQNRKTVAGVHVRSRMAPIDLSSGFALLSPVKRAKMARFFFIYKIPIKRF